MRKWLIKWLLKWQGQEFAKEPIETIEYKADLARQILENPLMEEIFNNIDTQINVVWKSTVYKEAEEREVLFYRYEALQKVRNMIKGYLNEALYEKHLKALQSEEVSEEQGG